MTNRLAQETSPYLLQHAGNPVDWHAWGPEVFERARRERKPVLVSIGYSSCHWCHVMERESFDDEATAALMNELFVSVKVDREERPDVDSVYMDAVVALTGQGGWPLTVFLTPDGEPFFGGTYFPPEPRHGLPSFRQVLRAVADAYRERPEDIAAQAEALTGHIRSSARFSRSEEPLDRSLLARAVDNLDAGFDPTWGGWGHAPKFPNAPALEFLLRRGEADMTRQTLDAMAEGGMHDLVGGGFHRYSVDATWLVPHFEKMLYDNALLASVYLHAAERLSEERYWEIADRTLDYMVLHLRLEDGGFASSEDADTDGVEGLTYTWTGAEGFPPELLQPFEHGRFVVRGELDAETRAQMLAEREERAQPPRDDKVIASWNGLTLAALAQSGTRNGPAVTLAEFLLGPLSSEDGRLYRTWRNGIAKGTGYLDDYANVAYGLMELHVATGDARWLREAHRLATLAVELFGEDAGGPFFQTPHDGEQLVARPVELQDHPLPSGNAMLAYVLLRLARIWGDDELESRGAEVLGAAADAMARAPSAFGWLLVALDQYLAPRREIAVVGDPGSPVAHAAIARMAATDVVAFGPANDIPLLAGKGLVDGKPAVYVCERFACRAPVTDPAEL